MLALTLEIRSRARELEIYIHDHIHPTIGAILMALADQVNYESFSNRMDASKQQN